MKPVGPVVRRALSSSAVRVATWNVNSLKARMPRVEEWLVQAQPDVVCLQETKLSDAAFPAMAFQTLGYDSAHFGQGQWNGVAILSRVGIENIQNGFIEGLGGSGPVDEYTQGVLNEARHITATCGGVRITSVYVPNGRSVDDPHYGAKLEWLLRLREQLATTATPTDPIIIAGDFNIAPEDRDVWDIKKFADSTHVTAAERERLAAFAEWGLVDAFRAKHDSDRLYSYWDYRAGDFHEHRGMRIDLVLATQPIVDRLDWAIVDRIARKGKLPSDHAPVVIEFASPASIASASVASAS
jgi:exodeoxyribonuclease III